jgi:hypothetical protein
MYLSSEVGCASHDFQRHQSASIVQELKLISIKQNKRTSSNSKPLQIKSFAQVNGVHVWLVAHPKQLQQWKGEAPTLYDIAGSAHFINKADFGLVVHRDFNSAMEKEEVSTGKGGHVEHPLARDPFGCRIIIRKVCQLSVFCYFSLS